MKDLTALTEPQAELYCWIVQYINQRGITPTYREMRDGMGLKSLSAIQSRLECLRRKGYIKNREGSRSIEVIGGSPKGMLVSGKTLDNGSVREYVTGLNYFDIEVKGKTALRVTDDSLRDFAIAPGDILLCRYALQEEIPDVGTLIIGITSYGSGQMKVLKYDPKSTDVVIFKIICGVLRNAEDTE